MQINGKNPIDFPKTWSLYSILPIGYLLHLIYCNHKGDPTSDRRRSRHFVPPGPRFSTPSGAFGLLPKLDTRNNRDFGGAMIRLVLDEVSGAV